MKSSLGSAAVSAFRTVSPPMPESNTPMGRSIAAREQRIRPLEAAIELRRTTDVFRVGISSAREAFANYSRSNGRCAKDAFVDAGRFHAQIGGDFRAGFSETIGERAVKTEAQRRECPKAAIRGEHVLAARHRIAGEKAAGGAAPPRAHAQAAHADERDLFGRNDVQQLVYQQNVIALGAGICDQRIEVKRDARSEE